MKLRVENGLPLVYLRFTYRNNSIELPDVLFDTGCATTIFDTDAMAAVNLELDLINGTAKRMYGVGGKSELCYEQTVSEIMIDLVLLSSFPLQLGMTREQYGFDGILGFDFMVKAGVIVDFKQMKVDY